MELKQNSIGFQVKELALTIGALESPRGGSQTLRIRGDICPLGSNWLFGEIEEVSQIGWVELVAGRVNGDSRYHLTPTGQVQLYMGSDI